jgi:hypothetical protein
MDTQRPQEHVSSSLEESPHGPGLSGLFKH